MPSFPRITAGLALAVLATAVTACGGGQDGAGKAATVEIWVRQHAAGNLQSAAKAYNAKGGTQIKVTPVPNDDWVTKVTAAAGARRLPDILSLDVVTLPQMIKQGIAGDITDKVAALPFKDKLLPGHMRLATVDGKTYAVPGGADVSALFYNKTLFKKAGLDPDQPPTNFAELKEDAKKITALGDGVKGFYFSGNCTGCNAFTWMPVLWAGGGDLLSPDGKTATVDTPQVKAALKAYNDLWKSGDVPEDAKTDDGKNFSSAFTTGKVGMQAIGAFALPDYKAKFPDLDFGVAPIPGVDGGQGAFAGGDVLSISSTSANPGPAWDFLTYFLSEEVQVEVLAKSGALVLRTDLAENAYAKQDPKVVQMNKLLAIAKTPKAVPYNELVNDVNGPFLSLVTQGMVGGDVDRTTADVQARFTEILQSDAG
ncbi:MAG: sugar ABC transporter substrate-binding protein [Nonomuraea sp.]|nr:sugar ABC transporter substrate-binding protein [Streptomyces sp.]NUP84048.1 sugar ABC transporter substrate-binding protein [Nonomuraea sp.]